MKRIILSLCFLASSAFASKYANTTISSSVSMGASFNSSAVDVNQLNVLAIQAVWTGGTAAGTLKVQVSNDGVTEAAKVTNWIDYTGSSVSVSGAGNELYNMSFAGYKWVRLVYTRASGTGTLNAVLSGKGIN